MSRFQSRDNSAAVSLFPFLAVLLCTMGGLVVLLVAMSHASRQMARREQAQPRPEVTAQSEEAARQLAEAEAYAASLAELERRAAEQLRNDQLRIAQVEDHVRKLQEEMAAIMATAQELEADESHHYDDRAQAERELAQFAAADRRHRGGDRPAQVGTRGPPQVLRGIALQGTERHRAASRSTSSAGRNASCFSPKGSS